MAIELYMLQYVLIGLPKMSSREGRGTPALSSEVGGRIGFTVTETDGCSISWLLSYEYKTDSLSMNSRGTPVRVYSNIQQGTSFLDHTGRIPDRQDVRGGDYGVCRLMR
jgi:hypothetical protein